MTSSDSETDSKPIIIIIIIIKTFQLINLKLFWALSFFLKIFFIF